MTEETWLAGLNIIECSVATYSVEQNAEFNVEQCQSCFAVRFSCLHVVLKLKNRDHDVREYTFTVVEKLSSL